MKFSHFIEQSSRDWETTVCQNVALTVIHTQNIRYSAWKLSEKTLQSHGDDLKSKENYGTDLSHSFSSFHDLLPAIGDQRCYAM